jgi:hydroxymethylglutaryl-CoA reductase (NADPH)
MDLRNLPDGLTPEQRCELRRERIEAELGTDLSAVQCDGKRIGTAEEKNCEQMFGHVPLPVGLAGPLHVRFSSGEEADIFLPLATTEGALIASVNRGCKAITESGNAESSHVHHGTSRSIAFRIDGLPGGAPHSGAKTGVQSFMAFLSGKIDEWIAVGETTSGHLKVLSHTIDAKDNHVFLTIFCDTDEAMGMNMVTIAAQAIGEWVTAHAEGDVAFVTVAGNVDSDKKPSARVHEHGRGYGVTASVTLAKSVIESVLKTTPDAMFAVARAKLELGSTVAGAIGRNLHAANIVAALYLATGQDAAHVVEGSLTDTTVEPSGDGLKVTVRLPAVMVGVRGGGTALPAQSTCLDLLLKPKTSLRNPAQLAESVGIAVLAGEISLLAAQAGHSLAKAHKTLGR